MAPLLPGVARHRDYEEPEEDGPEPEEAPGSRAYHLVGRSGPASTCSPDVIASVAKALARGCTRRQAAALAGVTSANLLTTWVKRGLEELDEFENGKRTETSVLATLAFEVSRAEAHYQAELIDIGNKASVNKGLSDKWVRWRLAVAAPKDFTVPAASLGPASQGLGPAFELVTPEEAATTLDEKLARFLEERDKQLALEAAPPADEPAHAD